MKLGLFPGQGIPATSILDSLPREDPLVKRASEHLGYDLRRKVIAHSHGKSLPTWLAQPAIFVGGMIAHSDTERYDLYIGHSVGEFTALAAAGAISFETGLSLLAVRGRSMHRAAMQHPGGMVAVLDLDESSVREIAAAEGAYIANLNGPGQIVIAGDNEALTRVSSKVRGSGGRAVLLAVQGAFHTPMMEQAGEALREALMQVEVRMPAAPVVSNLTARPYRAPGEIRHLLVEQVSTTIRFSDCLTWARDAGVQSYDDLGPGNVVGRLADRVLSHPKETVHA